MDSTPSSRRQSLLFGTRCRCREDRVRSTVLKTLRCSGYPPLWKVDCEVDGDTVILHGVVPTYHLKQLVQTLVLNLGEVQEVDNQVEVH